MFEPSTSTKDCTKDMTQSSCFGHGSNLKILKVHVSVTAFRTCLFRHPLIDDQHVLFWFRGYCEFQVVEP